MNHLFATMLAVLLIAHPVFATVWTPIESGVESALIDLYFHDASDGVAVGVGGTVLLTSDGGESWVAPAGSLPGSEDLHGVSFGDSLHGVVVGIAGSVWWTADAGQNWTAGVSGTSENLFEVAMLGPVEGIAVGWGGTVLGTTDGGANWAPLPSGTTEPLWGLSALDASTVVAVGDYTILRTADAVRAGPRSHIPWSTPGSTT